LKKTYLKRG